MEEILASIRRIIADDDPAKSPPKAAEPPPRPAPPPPPPRMAPAPPPRPAPPPPRPAPPPPELEPAQEDVDAMLAELQAKSQPPPEPVEEPASDILDLTEQMTEAPPAPAAGFRTIDGQSDVVFEERAPDPPPPPRVEPPRRGQYDGGEGALMSAATGAAVDSAFNTLAQTVLVQNGRTLEDLVREMLRPLLKTWLDDNLPSMVERLVRAEIERVSRGRG
jgi:cell pole-organizing protein PopZ